MKKTHGKVCVCRVPRKNARQSLCLPCANAKTHGKHFFGRTFFFSVRLWKNARQSTSLLCARKIRTANIQAHGKYGVSRSESQRISMLNWGGNGREHMQVHPLDRTDTSDNFTIY
jgi:hypothetical protein